jgi:hypothetical protein
VVENTPDRTTYHFVNTAKGVNVLSKVVYKKEDRLVVYPFYVDRKTNETKNKYRKVVSITFEGFKGKLPSGFLTRPISGYGATSNLKLFIKFVEKKFDVSDIYISEKATYLCQSRKAFLNFSDYDKIRKGLSSINSASKEQGASFLDNYFSGYFPYKCERRKAHYQRNTIARIMTQYSNIETNLSSDDKAALFEFFDKLSLSRKDIFEKRDLIKTKEMIDKKFIEDIIQQFERYLKRKNISEQKWQDFFKENLWIFSQLFAQPTVLFKDKAYVGGKTISDEQGKIVDFLFKNKLTKNSALIEIKKHTTNMFNKKPYRGNDVFALNKELSGAVNQVLDQRDTYMKKFDSIKGNEDITALSPKCFVIIGRISDLSKEQCKCFELMRAALKDVEIITYDELYDRLKSILSIFSYKEEAKSVSAPAQAA